MMFFNLCNGIAICKHETNLLINTDVFNETVLCNKPAKHRYITA